MALDGKKKGFGFDVEGRLNKNQPEPTHTHNHTDTHTPKVRERKTARIQILTYPSLVGKLDDYAMMHNLSRAEAFERAVTEFLERHT